jgi:L-ascorbate metabolism protein UlaG (beta-lactamase superfamily)
VGYVKWLGHAAFEISLDGKLILVDPWLTNPLSPVKPEQFRDRVDLIVVTHDHGDHLGETLELLRLNPKAKLVAVYEIANYVGSKLGETERAIGANVGGPVRVEGFDIKVILVPAVHSSERGVAAGVVLVGKEATIYHAGDTGLTADMQWIGELYKPDIALLPIGSHFTMDAVQAAKAVEYLKPKVAIPMHYNTFPVIKADPNEFKRLVEEKKLATKVVILKPGEKYEF